MPSERVINDSPARNRDSIVPEFFITKNYITMKTLLRAATQTLPSRLIENSKEDPFRVISEVFQSLFLEDLRDDLLPKWLRTTLINENSIYAEADHRTRLLHLYDHLRPFIEALYVMYVQQRETENPEIDYESIEIQKPILLTEDQLANPHSVIDEFKKQFPIEYIRRELWHFLEAGVNYTGDFPKGFAPGYALMCYDYLSCLTEASQQF